MPITINPTDEVIAASVRQVEVVDSAGRKIGLQKPGVLAQFRILETVGTEAAANSMYMLMTLPLLYVTSIDGDPIFFPVSKRQLEALIQRLDDHGVTAVMEGVRDHWGNPDPEADKALVKK